MSYKNLIEDSHVGPDEMHGKHCMLELFHCDSSRLNDELFIRTSLMLAAQVAGAKLLNMITHKFHPQGVTGLALLAESHLSIHTWPEIKYAAIDVFTCGQETLPEKACEFLVKELGASNHDLKSFIRNTPKKVNIIPRYPYSK
ncbi:adenosylmethionine decarboxylase [Prochlorococcus marinus]|uniref:adenosylmethionine decarboxylase n=1 Tax=Prochlorococcus marinus TaxID=1219 RepID=UPI0022B31F69|nr:adenosylmethionine decarboxylase [Prochlorococcus marinus]